MIRINDPHSINLIARAALVQFVPTHNHCIAEYNSTDRLIGGILFTDWNQGSVLMHFALFHPIGGSCRELLWLGFQYPFNQLGVKKVFGLVPEWNEAARKLDLHLGFKIEYLISDVFNNPEPMLNGMYLMSIRREDCKWLKMKPPEIHFAPPGATNQIFVPLKDQPGITIH